MAIRAPLRRIRSSLTPRRILAVGLVISAFALGRFSAGRGDEAALAAWLPEDGGFEVSFPAGWQPVRPSGLNTTVETLQPVTSSQP